MTIQWKGFWPGISSNFSFLDHQTCAGGVSGCCWALASGRRWSMEQKGT